MGEIAEVKKELKKRNTTSLRTYEEIRFRFILGETLVSLSEQFNIPLATLKDKSYKENWRLSRNLKDKKATMEYRKALIDKTYDYVNMYSDLRAKAKKMIKEIKTPKDLNLVTLTVKAIREEEFLCFSLRGGSDEEE